MLSGMMDKRLLLRGACGVVVVFLAIAVVDAALDEGTTRGARGDNGLAFMAADAVRFDSDDDSPMEAMGAAPPAAPMMFAGPRVAAKAMRAEAPAEEYGDAGRGRRSRSAGLGSQVLEGASAGGFDPASVASKIVRTGHVRIATAADVAAVGDAARALAEQAGGFVERREDGAGWLEGGVRRGMTCDLTLRVPVEQFYPSMSALKAGVAGAGPGDLEASGDAASDVTAEYVDAASRAATLEATRSQLLKLMESADEVKDVLNVQRELSSVTQQLEAKKNVMARLSKKAALSTINFFARAKDPDLKPPPSRPAWSPFATVRRALAWLSKLAQRAVDVAIFAAVLAAPLALVALAAWTCLPRGAKARIRDAFAPPPKGASMS